MHITKLYRKIVVQVLVTLMSFKYVEKKRKANHIDFTFFIVAFQTSQFIIYIE